jgi:RHS repeat-associated protein
MLPLGVGESFGGNLSSGQFDLIDMNADSLPDRVYSDGQVALNLGYRFGAKESWRNPAPLNDGHGVDGGVNLGFNTDFYGFAGGAAYDEGRSSTSSTLADMNGDGLPDRVFADAPLKVGLNTGNGFEPAVEFRGGLAVADGVGVDRNATVGGGLYVTFPICFLTFCVIINPGADLSHSVSRSERGLRDLNGDGFADMVSSTRDDQLVVAENQTGRTNLLRTVTRPLGGRIDFDYSRDGNNYGQPQSRFVLSKVSVDDGQPGDGQDVQLSTYEYSGGVYDRLEREFDGYATVVERQRDPGASDALFRSTTHQYRTDGHYTHGLPTLSFTTDKDGHKFTETENTYTLRDVDHPDATADPRSPTATIFAQLTRTDQRFYEGEDAPGKSTFTTLEYDQVGNVTRSVDAGEAGAGDDVEALITYSVDDSACRTSNITGVATATDVFGGGTLMRHRESTVDCATGNVTQIRAKLANDDTATTDMTYRADGNLSSVTGPANKAGDRFRLDYGYDGTVGTYPESVTDSFGYQSTSAHDFKFGTETSSTDVSNQVIATTFDSAGRPATVTGPYEAADGHVTISFDYHPEATVPYAVTHHVDRQADGTVRSDTIDTIAFVDGLGRAIQTKADSAVSTGPNTSPANVMTVSGRVVYDFLGRAVRTSFPTTEAKGSSNTTFNTAVDSVTPTVTTYDVLDRATKVVLPDSTQATSSFGFGADRAGVSQFETVTTDANGESVKTYDDVRQHTTTLKQFNPAGGQATILTSFGYDALGEKTSIVDDASKTTMVAYDNFGRQTSVTSPDTGRTDTVYDLAGNVTSKITAVLAAGSKAIEYDYDFNRLKAIRYPTFTANNVTYTYGAPGAANNAADRVTAITDGAGAVTREYGPLGEITKETRTNNGQGSHTFSFTTRYQYDTWNRVLKLTYPDGEVLSYHYNSGGLVDSAAGVKQGNTYTYLSRLDYDKFGQRALQDTGNGTRTQYTYDTVNQRLNNMKANLAQGYVFQDSNYTYDNVGNITQIRNDTVAPTDSSVGAQVGGPSTETFRYDDLYRLTHADGTYAPVSGATDTYTQDLHYDSVSNITNKTEQHQLVSNGKTTIDAKLTYNNDYAYGAAKPHAATTIGAFTFAYDQNGNQTSRTQQSGPRRQMIWDEENRIVCDHENVQNTTFPQTPASCDSTSQVPDARYFYDDAGERIIKAGSTFHVYPNQNFSTDGNQRFKHVFIGETKLLTKTVEDGKVENLQFYSHDDHLGSTGTITDNNGQLAEHLQYIPGGETWLDEHPTQPVPHQYTGKEQDPETGLYYYGARYYDPQTQNWQSPDPALPGNATDTTSLSTYLYAAANPIHYNDPDGRSPGTVTVHWASRHSWVTSYNPTTGESVTTHLTYELGGDGAIVENYDASGWNSAKYPVSEYTVDVPDIEGAQAWQKGVAAQGAAGEYDRICNSCRTHTADVIVAGGVKGVPTTRPEYGSWLPKNSRTSERGSASLAMMMNLALVGIIIADLYNDPSPQNVGRIGLALGEVTALDVLARRFLGGSIAASLIFFGGMRSDNAKFNSAQEQQEQIERLRKRIDDRAWDYWDDHPGIGLNAARAHVIFGILSSPAN